MKIGILTFHRVYNYGAVLQAYSTQKILDDLQVENDIIDFSLPKQKDLLALYSTKNGAKRFIKTLLLLPLHIKRASRINKFNRFISGLKLSDKTYLNEKALIETNELYDGFMIGSDQVWNVRKKAESSDAYFLNFVNNNKLKFSYATSIGISNYNDLLGKKCYLDLFSDLSCREKGGAEILSRLTGKEVQTVLDPTLLVNIKYLKNIAIEKEFTDYIFYYSLDGFDNRNKNKDILLELSKKFKLDIIMVTPEWPYHVFGRELVDVGPEEFLGLINRASLVCTNSFHGTALSIKFNIPFFVLEEKHILDERKRSILEQLDLEDRILSSKYQVQSINDYSVDFIKVNEKLEDLQEKSLRYLKNVINKSDRKDK